MTLGVMIALGLAFGLVLVWPLLRQGAVEPSEAEHAVSIYRDQLDELARDDAAGLIGAEERQAAAREIKARAGRAAKRLDASVIVARRSPLLAACLALATLGIAWGGYARLGSPNATDRPLAVRLAELETKQIDPVVPEALAPLPERWWAEAEAHAAAGDWASAAPAYRKAAEFSGSNPQVDAAYAEALTLANGNKVPQAARLVFAQVLVRNPEEPRARYYLALAKAQARDLEGALADRQALLADSAPNAPWVAVVRHDIANMARFTDTDLDTVLADAAPVERAEAGAAGDHQTRIAEIEASDPAKRGHEMWLELIRLKASVDPDAAQAVVAAARERFAGAPFVLGLIDRAEAGAGLGREAPPAPTSPRLPVSIRTSGTR